MTATGKHTPGPWVVGGESGNDSEAEFIVTKDESRTIAWTTNTFDADADDGYGSEVITEEDRANGRLIAAAPELLEALKSVVDQLEGIGIPDWHGAEGLCLESAKAAIAKAEGNQ